MTESAMSERNERLILGIDPGFGRMGYAVVATAGNDLRLIVCDAIMTPTGQEYSLRLQLIYEELSGGVALLTLVQSGLTIAEYTPSEVKLAITGYGAARKEQVGYMVRQLLNLPSIPRPDDAADAAAIAICHAHVPHYNTTVLSQSPHMSG